MQALKADLPSKAPKTVNNVLTVLGKTLRVAVKWKVIGTMPCTIELLKVSNLVREFYEFAEYGRLVDAAGRSTCALSSSCFSEATRGFEQAR